MKQIKIETQIKKILQSIIDDNGIKDMDTITTTSHIFMVAPNRWSYGYIIFSHDNQIWASDFNKNGKLCPPKPFSEFWIANKGYFTQQGWGKKQ